MNAPAPSIAPSVHGWMGATAVALAGSAILNGAADWLDWLFLFVGAGNIVIAAALPQPRKR